MIIRLYANDAVEEVDEHTSIIENKYYTADIKISLVKSLDINKFEMHINNAECCIIALSNEVLNYLHIYSNENLYIITMVCGMTSNMTCVYIFRR